MKSKRSFHKLYGRMDNRGFSLLELLVSILILVLIMVPLMHNFIRSAKINDQAEKLQDYSVISSNIVEDINSMKLSEVLTKYGLDGLKKVGTAYSEQDYTSADIDLDTYYFGLTKQSNDGTQYKVLVTVNANTYKNAATLDGTNDFKMPDIATVDDELNGMFFSDIFMNNATNAPVTSSDGLHDLNTDIEASKITGTPINYQSLDRIALNYFLSLADDYANALFKANSSVYAGYLADKQAYQEAIINGTTPPAVPSEPTRYSDPAYASLNWCMTDNLLKWITRTTNIDITKTSDATSSKTIITYQVTYQCDWPTGVELPATRSYEIQTKQYSSLINNVYLYYHPSIFQQYSLLNYKPTTGVIHSDNINVNNTSSKQVNLYIVNLSSGITAYVNSDASKDGIGPGNTSFKLLDTNRISNSVITSGEPTAIIYKNCDYTTTSNLNIYTNLSDVIEYVSGTLVAAGAQDINKGKIVSSAAENRIYSVNVQIYENSDTDPYNADKLLYDLDTNREK